jgi:hypothetical protein
MFSPDRKTFLQAGRSFPGQEEFYAIFLQTVIILSALEGLFSSMTIFSKLKIFLKAGIIFCRLKKFSSSVWRMHSRINME